MGTVAAAIKKLLNSCSRSFSFLLHLISSFPKGGDGHSSLSIKVLRIPHSNYPGWGSPPPNSFYILSRMGQRHNRRRTRRSSHRTVNQDSTAFVNYISRSPILAQSSIWRPQPSPSGSPAASYSTACIPRGSPIPVPAPTWHYGYSAWQIRETKPQETGGLEAEQYRLFGGEPGDDVNLCYRMLEYFGGLDYIDS